MTAGEGPSSGGLGRVEVLTLGLGAAAGLYAGVRWGWLAAAGFLVGVLISWVNFRWLKQGVEALGRVAMARAGEENLPLDVDRGTLSGSRRARIPKRAYMKLIGRYVLLLVALCGILLGSWLPGGAVVAGLFAAVAAVLLDMLYRLYRGFQRGAG
jgi:hypothetical protein